MSDILSHIQKLDAEELVTLWRLYLYSTPAQTFYFHGHNSAQWSGQLFQGGLAYQPWPIDAEGFERSTSAIARPKLSVGNVDGLIGELCRQNSDLVGSAIIRIRTFAKYLDYYPAQDATAMLPVQGYRVNRKVTETKSVIVFELSPTWDITGTQIPRRMCLKHSCQSKYRGPECGYVGGYVDINGNATPYAWLDVCGKRLDDCRARFGNTPLPFGAFPGLMRLGQG
jgi:lambda family phage minor tail protein L